MSETEGQAVDPEALEHFQKTFAKAAEAIGTVVRGKTDAVRHSLVCLLAEGHLLIEDSPGLAKTTLARCIAACLGGQWRRIQFTPDLLPGDITGVTVFDQVERRPRFREGPVFANVVIADEINRASPKTQSALLEVMEERRVTALGEAHEVPTPFFVVATQNPVDMEGTYALPEAQLDRFTMRVRMGYPSLETETDIALSGPAAPQPPSLPACLDAAVFAELVGIARRVNCERAVAEYAVRLAAATRRRGGLRLGASPRGSIALVRAARVLAAAQG